MEDQRVEGMSEGTNIHFEDSRKSEDSYLIHCEESADGDSYDGWADESYYNMPETIEEESKIALRSGSFEALLKAVQDSHTETVQSVPEPLEIYEENNNDPNNNTGATMMTLPEPLPLPRPPPHVAAVEPIVRAEDKPPVMIIERVESPTPGCSKDSWPRWTKAVPVSGEPVPKSTVRVRAPIFQAPNDEAVLEKTRHVLGLLSKVHRDSVFEAIHKNSGRSVRKLKLWDLLPESERREYPEIIPIAKNRYSGTSEYEMINNAKRRQDDDICTTNTKKTTSEPNPPIVAPAIPLPTIPKVSASSTVVNFQGVAHRGAIPKVRDVSTRQQQPQSMIPIYLKKQHYGKFYRVEPKSNDHHRSYNHSRSPAPQTDVYVRPPILKNHVNLPTNVPVVPAPSPQRNCHRQDEEVQVIKEKPPATHQVPKKVVCMEMYYKLRVIFPNVDPEYIKNLCPPDWSSGDRDAQLAPLIEHILEQGDNLPQVPVKEATDRNETGVNCANADDIYENLIGIFPDADPHYLRDFAVKNTGNSEALKNFVESKLERRDYPTREQYMARLKITEAQRQYTTGFDIKQFLSIIPDPSTHFLDRNRKCAYQTVAFEFLKSYFNKNRVSTISKAYERSNRNLSLTAECLEYCGTDLKSKRGGYEIPTEDILLLQEIAFIKHKGEINAYMENVKRLEDEEFKALKATNHLLECQCCFDSECLPSKCSNCDNGHVFCNSCIVTGTSAKMAEDQTRISCFVNCGSEFSLSVLQRVLVPTTFSILLKKRQAAEVIEAGLEGLVSCPFCHFASIPPEGDKVFKCLNPECTKESCRLCKELSHVPLKCNEVMKADKARRYIEEKMTEALARKCYRCQRSYFKEEGCNKITCPCGAQMCYLCDKPITDYTHFRAQGGDDTSLCPLYSDTIRMDAVAVRKVAEEAQQQLLKRDPNIKIDTSSLLPNIPLPRRGPHNEVLNADELPLRAQRVIDLPPL